MKYQKLNNMEVVGFRDNNPKRERYVVILEDDENGPTAEEKYKKLNVPVMSYKKRKA